MTRTQACRDQLGWMVENCPLDRTSIIPIKRAHKFCEDHVEISTLSTDAIQPLAMMKDVKVQEKVVADLKKMIDAGKKPTRRDVVVCIQNERLEREQKREDGLQKPTPSEVATQIGQKKEQITKYEAKIEIIRKEIDSLLEHLPHPKWDPGWPMEKLEEYELKNSKLLSRKERGALRNAIHAAWSGPADDSVVTPETTVAEKDSFGVTEPSGKNTTTGHDAARAKLTKGEVRQQ